MLDGRCNRRTYVKQNMLDALELGHVRTLVELLPQEGMFYTRYPARAAGLKYTASSHWRWWVPLTIGRSRHSGSLRVLDAFTF